MTNEMKSIVDDLNRTVSGFLTKLNRMSEVDFRAKPRSDKWSRIEVMGHLIDSAHSNLRRLVTGQYEPSPPHIIYDQNFWVVANNYQAMPMVSVITLWNLMNRQIAEVLTSMPEANYSRQCDTGRGEEDLHTLVWLAADYVKHMKHHLNQVIPGSYNVTYP